MRLLETPALLAAGIAALALLSEAGSELVQRPTTLMLIHVTLVVGLYCFTGLSGVFSFGHVAFMAVGAYASALLTMPVQLKSVLLPDLPVHVLATTSLPGVPAALIAGLVAVVVAMVAGAPLMRLSGMTAGIATFSLLVIVQVVIGRWTALTNGEKALSGVPITTGTGIALAWAVVAIFAVYLFQESKPGLRLRATREDEFAARSIGVDVVRERLLAFTLAAFFFAIGGVLSGHFLGSIAPTNFFITQTFVVVVMLVVGGIYSLTGAVVGVVVISALGELFIRLERGMDIGPLSVTAPAGFQQMGYAVALIAILVFRPDGLMKGREVSWPSGGLTRWVLSMRTDTARKG